MTSDRFSSDSDLIGRLRAIVGDDHVLSTAADQAPFLRERRELYRGVTRAVVRPGSRDEASAVLALCHETDTAVVPQGGNTGLVGGQIPMNGEIVLSLTRLAALREVDIVNGTMTVEAGMTLDAVRAAADRAGRLFPLWFASAGTCTIGGNLATNAGGVNVIAFGNTRDLINGVEIVMADGRVLSDLSKLKKDNTGYDLKSLFIGSEGTLGIITAAVLKLRPRPRSVETAFVGVASPADALSLLQRLANAMAGEIRAFELIPRIALDFVLESVPTTREPLHDPHAWYVLIELATQSDEALHDKLFAFLRSASERGLVEDATVASSVAQSAALWALRENISEAQRHFGGSIKHDVSVPVASVPAFLSEVEAKLRTVMPGARLCAFGHLGDGNIHCNVQQPAGADKADFLSRWDEINTVVHDIVAAFGGSISAEHGIGQLKRSLLPKVKDPVALETMRAIKRALDPRGILNPGKVL